MLRVIQHLVVTGLTFVHIPVYQCIMLIVSEVLLTKSIVKYLEFMYYPAFTIMFGREEIKKIC